MRDIKDDVVKERLKAMKEKNPYIMEMQRYTGKVNDVLGRVDFQRSLLGVPVIPVYEGLKQKYDLLHIKDDNFIIEAGNFSRRITSTQSKLLKALALEQLSANSEYSYVVASIFKQVLVAAIKGCKPVWCKPIEYLEDSCIYEELVKWIDSEVLNK